MPEALEETSLAHEKKTTTISIEEPHKHCTYFVWSGLHMQEGVSPYDSLTTAEVE